MDYGVITFTSTYGAIYAQKVLRPVADVLTMPVLREISLGLRHRRALPAGGRGGGCAPPWPPPPCGRTSTPFTVLPAPGRPCGPSRWTGRGRPALRRSSR